MSSYALNDDGTATFDFGTFTRVTKRPTLRQYRDCVELLDQRADGSAKVRIDQVITWWDEVFIRLSGEGLPRVDTTDPETNETVSIIDEERLPPWMITDVAMVNLIVHWQQVPSLPGDR